MRRIIEDRICDFTKDGSPCGEKVEQPAVAFTLGTAQYELDYCDKHRTAFDKALAPFVDGAEPLRKKVGKATARAARSQTGTFTVKDVREWLQKQGREIGPTGRIPNVLIEEYKVAHNV